MSHSYPDEKESLVPIIRYFIGYLWLVVFFGCVIFIVQASMEIKRLGYQVTAKIETKIDLMDETRKIDNLISEKESYQRIAYLLETHRPELGPPRYPAIELVVPGLRERSGLPQATLVVPDDRNIIDRLRHSWRKAEEQFRVWLNDLLE